MPFAKKFRAMMDFPLAGDTVGDFVVESVDVRNVREDVEGHVYAVEMTLRGPGGQQGVRRALNPLLAAHPTTFSGYGNPYQLWFSRPEIEGLGDSRYEVRVKGMGVRVYLEPELTRFLAYLDEQGHLSGQGDLADRSEYKTWLNTVIICSNCARSLSRRSLRSSLSRPGWIACALAMMG